MDGVDFEKALDVILERDGRYHREAYLFLRDALEDTQRRLRGAGAGSGAERGTGNGIRHVSGQELLEGIRVYGLEVYGPMALWVFNEWGIRGCEDFGDLVFNLIEGGLFAKTEKDNRDDFRSGYVFEEVFRRPFLPRQGSCSSASSSSLKGNEVEDKGGGRRGEGGAERRGEGEGEKKRVECKKKKIFY